MVFTLAEIAQKLSCSVAGNPETPITGVAGLDAAQSGQLTFLSNPKYGSLVQSTRASAIIASKPVEHLATLISKNPYLDFAPVSAIILHAA